MLGQIAGAARDLVSPVATASRSSAAHAITYRPDIDGLRAIAVGFVVIFHAFPYRLAGGFIGVDIFFVISGFLITSLIAAELDKGNFSLLRFYQRRITRLYPALVVVLSAVLGFGYLALFSLEFQALGKHLAGGAAFVSNFVLMGEAGYFDEGAVLKPLQHLWSLGVEEQFYLVWPLFLMLVCRRGVSRRRLLLLGAIASVAIASFCYGLYLIGQDTAQAYYSPLVRFWELLAGAFLAVGGRKATGARTINVAHAASVAGLLLLVAGAGVFIQKDTPFPGWFALFPVVGAVLIIAAGPHALVNRWILSNRVMVYVGLISYPLYLWHWPVLSYISIVQSDEPTGLTAVVAVMTSLALAAATYSWVERPLHKVRNKPATGLVLLGAILAIGSIGLGVYVGGGMPDRPLIAKADAIQRQFVSSTWPYSSNQACESRYPVADSSHYAWWFCMLSADRPPTLLLVGTSHANHLYPGLVNNPALSHQTILNIGTCEPSWVGKDFVRSSTPANFPCGGSRHRQHQELIDKIAASGSVKYVILAGLDTSVGDVAGGDYADRLLRRVETLEADGIRVILFAPQLKWAFDVKRCFPRPFRDTVAGAACDLSYTARQEARMNFEPVARKLREHHPSILIFDPNDVFCNNQACSIVRDGMPLYRDKYEHLSIFGSTKVAEMFVAWARINLPEVLNPNGLSRVRADGPLRHQ